MHTACTSEILAAKERNEIEILAGRNKKCSRLKIRCVVGQRDAGVMESANEKNCLEAGKRQHLDVLGGVCLGG